jgi:serine protease Do
MAMEVSRTIIAKGKVERGWLGLGVQDLTPDLAKSLGALVNRGAVVESVVKGGPAERAGLKKGDIIVSFQGSEISDGAGLRSMAGLTPIGQEVKLGVLRQGKRFDLVAKIGNLEEAARHTAETTKERLGVEVRAATAHEAERFGLDAKQGVTITWVDPKGPLGAMGFEVGDMILAINDQAITGIETFIELVGGLRPKQQVTLLALDRRTGNSGTVQVIAR